MAEKRYRIYIYGTGKLAYFLQTLLKPEKVTFLGYVSNESVLPYEMFRGYPLATEEELDGMDYDYCLHTDSAGDILKDRRHINVWKSLAVVSMGLNPEYYILRRRAKNDLVYGGVKGVVTGLSYTQKGILWERLTKKMSMCAGPSQDLYYDFLTLADAIKRTDRGIKYVIMGLAPYSLRHDLSLSKEINYRCIYYYNEFKDWHHAEYPANEIKFMEGIDEILNECLDARWRDVLGDVIIDGSFPRIRSEFSFDDQPDSAKEASLTKMRRLSNKPYHETVQEYKMIFEMYLKLCSKQRIRLLVLLPPFSSFFRAHFPAEYVGELREFIIGMKEQYLFDYMDLYEDERFMGKNYYEDEDHLNVSGAEKLTEIINETVREWE